MIKFQKGFTLIELLVVIAIIGILAGILFVAIDPAAQTNKAEDAKAKSQLSQARTQSAISFSDTSNSYDDVCTDIVTLVDDCFDSPSAWAASVNLVSAGATAVFCADSTGLTVGQGAPPAGVTC